MTSHLEKIDLLRARTGVSYKKAREALDQAEGDVVEALIGLEEKNRKLGEKLQVRSENALDMLKGFMQKGQAAKVKLKKDDRTVIEVPATLGALGLLGVMVSSELALLGAVATVAAVAKKYTLEIDCPGEENYMDDE